MGMDRTLMALGIMLPHMLGGSWLPLQVLKACGVVPLPPSL